MRSTVDLPQPEGPTSTMNSPGSIARSRSRTASTPPRKRLPTPSRRMPTAGRLDDAEDASRGDGGDAGGAFAVEVTSSLERAGHQAAHEEPPEEDVDQQGR